MRKMHRMIAIALALLVLLALASYQWILSEREEGYAFDSSLSPSILQLGAMNLRARLSNDPAAQYALGRYERFVNLDFTASNQWMEKSAANGYPDALYMLAAERLNSINPMSAAQKAKAYELMQRAAQAGNVSAKQYLENQPDSGAASVQEAH